MNIKTVGHVYELANFENPEVIQTISFIHKEPMETISDGRLVTVSDGTTNEEVLDMLVDRIRFLNNKLPCQENLDVIGHLLEAIEILNKRTEDRKSKNIEGTNLVN